MGFYSGASFIPVKTVFTGMACANCMKPSSTSVKLFQCSQCKRSKYCSKQCQTEDWKIHKAECKFLIHFQKVFYPEYLSSLQQGGGSWSSSITCYKRPPLPTLSQIYRKAVDGLIQQKILLPSTRKNIERHILFIQLGRVCRVCETNEYDVFLPQEPLPPQQQPAQGTGGDNNSNMPPLHKEADWKCCPTCHFGWCCCQTHYDECRHKHTAEICEKYVRSIKLGTFHWKHMKDEEDKFHFQPDTVMDSAFKRFPNDWDEYFKKRCPDNYSMSCSGRLHPEFLPASTDQLSPPLTCLYAMYCHGIERVIKDLPQRELTIHVVGPSPNFELFPSCVWEEILHCLPSVQSVHVVFVGPDACLGVVPTTTKMGPTRNQACPACTPRNRSTIYSYFAMTYHDYYQQACPDNFTTPQLVVAFNTGMYEEYTDSWKSSLAVILDLNFPAMFTSYNLQEAKEDYKVLESMTAKLITPEPVLNPFRNEKIEIEATGYDGFYQNNMYCMAFQGRSS